MVRGEVRGRKGVRWLVWCNPAVVPFGQGGVPLLTLSPQWRFHERLSDNPPGTSDCGWWEWSPFRLLSIWRPFLLSFQAIYPRRIQDDPRLTPLPSLPNMGLCGPLNTLTHPVPHCSWRCTLFPPDSLQSVAKDSFRRVLSVDFFQTSFDRDANDFCLVEEITSMGYDLWSWWNTDRFYT